MFRYIVCAKEGDIFRAKRVGFRIAAYLRGLNSVPSGMVIIDDGYADDFSRLKNCNAVVCDFERSLPFIPEHKNLYIPEIYSEYVKDATYLIRSDLPHLQEVLEEKIVQRKKIALEMVKTNTIEAFRETAKLAESFGITEGFVLYPDAVSLGL